MHGPKNKKEQIECYRNGQVTMCIMCHIIVIVIIIKLYLLSVGRGA